MILTEPRTRSKRAKIDEDYDEEEAKDTAMPQRLRRRTCPLPEEDGEFEPRNENVNR